MNDVSLRITAQKLEAAALRRTVSRAGLYLVAFELLRYDVVEQTKGFFCHGFNSSGLIYSPDYKAKVLSLATHPYDASAKWFVTMEAITSQQADELIAIRKHRNDIAHELPSLLIDPTSHLSRDLLVRTRFFVDLLGRFWGGITASTDPTFDGQEIDERNIKSGSSMLLDVIWDATEENAT